MSKEFASAALSDAWGLLNATDPETARAKPGSRARCWTATRPSQIIAHRIALCDVHDASRLFSSKLDNLHQDGARAAFGAGRLTRDDHLAWQASATSRGFAPLVGKTGLRTLDALQAFCAPSRR
jgi:hypothetical protein